MLAISAQIDDKVQQDIQKCGFSDILLVPLKVSHIKQSIIPPLEMRDEELLQKESML